MATRGRPRTFDRQVALRRAMEVFWRRGYQGASMTELTAAMGIASPSLYAAFGSKEALFREAVELYNSTEGAGPRAALDGGVTARAAIEAMLRHQAYAYVDPANPSGCLVVLAGAGTVPESDAVGQFLTTCRERDITELRRRISRGVDEGDLPASVVPDALARFVGAVVQGMAVQARDGASAEDLLGIVDCAMAAWDGLTRDGAATT
ncbi:TetR/AcrR family transcriptional regulator [Micromonospora andamanensis]|uniref:TetR/AcrR family transcriptional regulator n=1 Tax=Micromonospora andamanensis TaxID=1287068 RepID=UPI00194E4873|nr:TetR/AcrR family transcriptional regulator [Micromonospora andamanensis]GIJ38711.1 TetR family transcriptional regulator [Micromonospora andamanensis]